jgi:hypothetical protein
MSDHGAEPREEFRHEHDRLVHSHRHHHVTHNYRALTGTFEHLSSQHEHEHDHSALTHEHLPHEDFEKEHLGEAHVHDHAQPVDGKSGGKAAASTNGADGAENAPEPRKAAARKAPASRKKAEA